MKQITISLVTALAVAACASTPAPQKSTENTKSSSQVTTPQTQAAPTASTQSLNSAKLDVPAYLDPANPLSQKRSFYFDFDKYVVRSQDLPIADMHSQYLSSHHDQKIKIEGNADERGSREYNLALGQKRADAVKIQMKTQGVVESQIETISWGKEKPKANGHDETAWAENRRADIRYAGEGK